MTPTLILTADPAFADLALAELLTAVPAAVVGRELAAGVYPISLPGSFAMLAAIWREAPPIFARHICPVQAVYPALDDGDNTVAPPVTAVAPPATAVAEDFAVLLDSAATFSVQTRVLTSSLKPFAINRALSTALQQATNTALDVRAPDQIVSVVVADATYVGLSAAADNLSNWAGGEHRFRREKGQVSRAAFKLLEALAVFDVTLPRRGGALDLGAAPGGWTQVLRQRGLTVTAVDPATLHPSLQQDGGVRHLPITAEAYLRQGPAAFDIIVNDMRLDVRVSARLMAAFAPSLRNEGVAIMTFKLPERGRRRVLQQGLATLRSAYDVIGVRQLFHNRSEVTIYLRPRR